MLKRNVPDFEMLKMKMERISRKKILSKIRVHSFLKRDLGSALDM